MNRVLRCLLYELAWRCLGRIRWPPESSVEVAVNDGTTTLSLIVRPTKPTQLDAAPQQALLFRTALSPLEKQILDAIGSGRLPGKAIAAKTRHLDSNGQANDQIRGVIGNLVDRGILDDGDGYGLTEDGRELAKLLVEPA
jgi:hypothetical protein